MVERRDRPSRTAAQAGAREPGTLTATPGSDTPDMPKGPYPMTPYGVRALRRRTEERRCCYPARASASRETNHVRLRPLLTLRDLELDPLALFKGAVAVHLNRAVVDEYIRTTVDRDEAVPLLRVEPLDGALSHA